MARSRRTSTGTPATVALAQAGVAFTTHTYEHDPAAASYGLEAAEVLGLDPDRVLKTLLAEVDGRLVVGIVPVNRQLDLKALASAVGGKRATMADPAAAERATGYVVGGISPLGQKRRHRSERLAPEVHVEARGDHLATPVGERVADVDYPFVEELSLLDGDDVGRGFHALEQFVAR